MGSWIAGVFGGACAAECAKDVKCGYWMVHETNGVCVKPQTSLLAEHVVVVAMVVGKALDLHASASHAFPPCTH